MADPPRQDDATRSLLLEQFAVEQFLLGLSLVDRFLLDVLIVPTPRVARAVLALLRDELPARRAEPLDVRVFAPDPAKASALDPVEASALVADVLTPLLQPAEPTAGRMTLTWVDASDARAIDDEAWTEFFHRLNERRNAVVESQPGPLVLVLPYRLERTLAHAAPDVWSVRSGVYRVQVVDLETHVFDVETERHRPIGVAHAADTAPRSLTLAIALTGEEPARFDDKTRAWAFSETVPSLLSEGRLDEAETMARASLERARKAIKQSPESNDALNALARTLSIALEVAQILGNTRQSQILALELLTVVDQIIGDRTPSIPLLEMRARARAGAYMIAGSDGLEIAKQGVADARQLLSKDETSQEHAFLLIDCLSSVGQLELEANDTLAAVAALDESILLLGRIDRTSNQSIMTARLEIESRMLRARAFSRLNRPEDAIADARIALDRAKGIQHSWPRSVHSARLLVHTWTQLARTYRQQGDLFRAADSFTDVRKVTGSMARTWPQNAWAIYRYAIALRESAEVAREAGDPNQARAWVDEALDLTTTLIKRLPEDEHFRVEQAALLALQHHLQPPTDPT